MCKKCIYFPCTREECNIQCGNCIYYKSIISKFSEKEIKNECNK